MDGAFSHDVCLASWHRSFANDSIIGVSGSRMLHTDGVRQPCIEGRQTQSHVEYTRDLFSNLGMACSSPWTPKTFREE